MNIFSDPYYQAAFSIVNLLIKRGYVAYFAGGWVRDYLLGHPSQDIDIATNASAETIIEIFPHTVPVGIAFGVVLVIESGYHFEVATFRRDIGYVDGRRPEKIELASIEEDVSRRDFTINGMFFDPLTNQIIDLVGGRKDLELRLIRTIGFPAARFEEDRHRMIRAVRFSARFGYTIEQETANAIKQYAHLLFPAVSVERVWQDFNKMCSDNHFDDALTALHHLGLLQTIFPNLRETYSDEIKRRVSSFSLMPKNAPTILYILKLFPHETLEFWLSIGKYLKIKNVDLALVQEYWNVRALLQKPFESIELAQLARMYASPNSKVCLESYYAEIENPLERISEHEHLQHYLKEDIKRIIYKQPLVGSAELKKEGILPGKQMGQLIQEAERIAINQRLHFSEDVVRLLKKSRYWAP